MPRQSFLSTDFFVEGAELETKEAVLEIPLFATIFSFFDENKLLQYLRFLYKDASGKEHFIDVSFISLNDGHTRVTLHARYANGKSFYKDPYIENALANFERAANAAVMGCQKSYVAAQPKVPKTTKLLKCVTALAYSTGVFFFLKK